MTRNPAESKSVAGAGGDDKQFCAASRVGPLASREPTSNGLCVRRGSVHGEIDAM